MAYIISALLFYLIILPISWLPFPLLYRFSDFLFLIFYYLFPYRRKVILSNLRLCFPEKTESEIKIIERKFYKHFCDLLLETLKLFSASRKSIESRMELVNSELLNKYYENGKSLILVTGHYANWEWAAITLSSHSKHHGTGIYQRLSSKFFDKLLRKTRAQFGV